MVALFQRLTNNDGLSPHSAWRAAFAIVPVPALITVAILILVFGSDHPAGKWSDRHRPLAAAGVEEANPELEERFLHEDAKMTGARMEYGVQTSVVAVGDTRGAYLRSYSSALNSIHLNLYMYST